MEKWVEIFIQVLMERKFGFKNLEIMYFSEAIDKLVYGKKIRRSSWGKNFWIESNGDAVFKKAYDPISKESFNIQRYAETDQIFSLQDTLANDWEIQSN